MYLKYSFYGGNVIKTALYVIIVGMSFFSFTSSAQDYYIRGPNYFGCVNKEKHNNLISIIVNNDTQAFNKGLGNAIKTGDCIRFPKGRKVFGIDVEISTGLIRIRPEGSETSYWTIREAIK